jgi:S1-C subfamily serine protease
VTLGVVPDYLFGGPGLKIDGATEGRPAANAGMKAGDIVLKIGDFTIDDIYAYMGALGAFKKGDTTTIVYKRGDEEIEAEITF